MSAQDNLSPEQFGDKYDPFSTDSLLGAMEESRETYGDEPVAEYQRAKDRAYNNSGAIPRADAPSA